MFKLSAPSRRWPSLTRMLSSSASSRSNPRLFGPHLDYRGLKAKVAAGTMAANAKNRNLDVNDLAQKVAALYDEKVSADFALEARRRERNALAAKVKGAATKGDRDALVAQAREVKADIAQKEQALGVLAAELYDAARLLPNDTCPSVPIGDESKAITLETVNSHILDRTQQPTPANHVDLCTLHDSADFLRASKVAGNGFYFLKNHGAMLEHALQRYALNFLTLHHGFTPVSVPDVIRHEVLEACGFAPRSTDSQTYFLSTQLDQSSDSSAVDPLRLCLAATAEFPLAAMHAGEVLSPKDLPIKYAGLGRAFRAEGLAGGINRGLYRVHQFSKVEMFALVAGGSDGLAASAAMLEEFRSIQRGIFEGLELCFRVLNMPTEELGAPAFKKYDMEAWMPGKNTWGEISSASNCTDYQSRRLNIRNLPASTKENGSQNMDKIEFVHTVNGTAAAIPRLIIAILETHQQPNGDIYIPLKLRPFLYGDKVEVIKANETFKALMARTMVQ